LLTALLGLPDLDYHIKYCNASVLLSLYIFIGLQFSLKSISGKYEPVFLFQEMSYTNFNLLAELIIKIEQQKMLCSCLSE
jgi:hypothetical protein